ncbi:MAG: DUF2723 domain-containing protein [Bacteroidetes bacterium]|nr:DUF2723 domain-containing protein [Bacteroidota bacterium]
MNNDILRRIIGAVVFIISAIQLIMTAQVSVPFWDPGELSAAAYLLQVPHPPGGPLFSMVGRIFYMLPIPGDIGFRMNVMSALASVFTVLLLYLIAIKVIEHFRKEPYGRLETLGTYLAAAVGALTLSFSDTFWFNAGEANYFAASTLLYASTLWLMLIWNEKADEPGSERYLLLIAYISGLSAGLHLMSVLTIIVVGIVVVIRKYVNNDEEFLQSSYIFLGNIALVTVVAALLWSRETSTQPPTQEMISSFEGKFLLAVLGLSILVVAVFWKKVFRRNSIYLAFLVGGLAFGVLFAGVIRYFPKLLLLVAGDHLEGGLLVLLGAMALLGFGAYYAMKKRQNLISFSLAASLIAVLGFTTYTMIVIRANKNLPMNENHPKSFAQLITYLNREQYGEFPTFKRRWSSEPEKAAIYKEYSSDFDFFLRYQMDHMFHRYVAWNFIGKISSDQDAGVDWKGLYGIPFFLGLFGLFTHFRKDWKMAAVFLFTFILMGYLITYYQNQQQPQPRDREYFYCGAYFVFALWIAIGIKGLLDFVQEKIISTKSAKAAVFGVLLLSTFIPLRMLYVNFPEHDRSKNWVPWDFAYNMLQTCEQDAILFTQGDNDTFPLWYMQDVEGVRRDVRIVNLSLVNTSWYILQMKNTPAYKEAKAVPMNMPDAFIEKIQPIFWEPRNFDIPVSKATIQYYKEQRGITLDPEIAKNEKITFFLPHTIQFGNTKALRVQDIAVLDIILANEWKRPIYFGATCSPDAKIGLDDYMWFKGLSWKLEPIKVTDINYGIDPVQLEANLMNEPADFSKTPQSGYKFRELANPDVHFDENTRRIITNYRAAFRGLASYYANVDPQKSIQVLDRMEALMPAEKIPYEWQYAWQMAVFYESLGRTDRAKRFTTEVETACLDLIAAGQVNMNSYYNPYRALLDIYEMTKEYDKLLNILRKLESSYPSDPTIKEKIRSVEQLKALSSAPAPQNEK